jgi:hypothetical protein
LQRCFVLSWVSTNELQMHVLLTLHYNGYPGTTKVMAMIVTLGIHKQNCVIALRWVSTNVNVFIYFVAMDDGIDGMITIYY